jgi:RNA polymerase I-specific transcription initiation factor RRN7
MSMHQACHAFAQKITQQYGLTIPEANIPPIAWKVVSSLGGTPTTHSQVFNLMRLLDVNLSLVNTGSVLVKRRVPINRSRSERRDTLPRSLPGSETEDVDSDGAFKDQEYQEYRKAKHYADIWIPELSVAGVWVMVMKMAYGLDGRER